LDLVYNTISIPSYDEDGNYLGAVHDYSWLAGTSMAAPQVAGAAALVKSVAPDYNPNQVEQTLERTAEVPKEYDKTYYGSGFIDPLEAVEDAE
jgi:subtilisin family serine protease